MTKRAIVFGGGGSRGPYHIGVWQALDELGIDCQIVTGTSVGAINGALYVQQDFAAAKNMWENLTTQDVIALPDLQTQQQKALLAFFRQAAANGGMDVTPLEKLLYQAINEQAVRASPIEYGLVTTQLQKVKPLQLCKADIPSGEMVDYILASAACFPFFQSREIDGVKYIDGAYSDNLPVDLAVTCGAAEIIAVDLRGPGRVHSCKHEIPVTYIRSHWDLGIFLIFDCEKAKRNMRLGYQDAMKAYHKLEGNAYAFVLGESRRNALCLHDAFAKIARRTGVNLFANYEQLSKIFEGPNLVDALFIKPNHVRFTLGHSITTAAEVTAELLGVEPDQIYSFGHLNRLILEKSMFLREKYAKLLAEKRMKNRRPLGQIYRLLKYAYETGMRREEIWGYSAAFGRDFIAANYILALEIYVANL